MVKTKKGEVESHSVVLADRDFIKKIIRDGVLYGFMDGTFSSAPKLSTVHQLYTIIMHVYGRVIRPS